MKKLAFFCLLAFFVSSCYSLKYDVGAGAQTGVQIKEKNHYVIYGLAPIKTSSPTEMANGAENYSVEIVHTFIDGLLNSITFGIYNPTTTIVTK